MKVMWQSYKEGEGEGKKKGKKQARENKIRQQEKNKIRKGRGHIVGGRARVKM